MARRKDMNGLVNFISELRKCKGKEEELKRVNKELGKIRSHFRNDASLNGYQKKKYISVVTAAVSLIDALVANKKIDPVACMSPAISKLHKIVNSNSADYADYSYHYVSAPWLTIKLLKLLKQCPYPKEITLQTGLLECVTVIFNNLQEPPKTKKVAHRNCKNAIMFETINLIHYMCMQPELQIGSCNILEVSLKHNEANSRYLVLEAMNILSGTEICRVRLKEQIKTVIDLMQREFDVCIRRKLTCLLYTLCDETNVQQVLKELFYCMQIEDITLREDMVLRMSILAEKYLQDRTSYVDVVLKILKVAGEYVPEAVGYKLIQVITNEEAIQAYAAKRAFEALETSFYSEKLVKVVGYILGEFGNLIAGDSKFSPIVQLRLLHSKFYLSSNNTKATLLTTYMKFANLYSDSFIREEIKQIFKINIHNIDSEIQQRAVEYLKLCEIAHEKTLITVFDKMPHVKKEICVEKALQKVKVETSEENPIKNIGSENSKYCNKILSKQYSVERKTLNKNESRDNIQNELVNLSDVGYNTLQGASLQSSKDCTFSQKLNSVWLISTNEALNFLIWHEKGILYESNILSLYTDTAFINYRGRIRLVYTNKTSEALNNFRPHFPDESLDKIKLDVTPSSFVLKPYESIEQVINVECIREFDYYPYMFLNFNFLNFTECVSIFLPLTLNKFIKPFTMTSEEFFRRWNLCNQNVEKTFPAKNIMERGSVANKIEGIGLMLLPNIDPNKENFVAAGIFHSKSNQIEILLRLQSDYKTRSYKLTVRSIQLTVSSEVAKLVVLIL
ncbi:hypothetical protein JTE90_016622 [Oedothorax gibbosus]|uniref:AP-2 complex subunit alpha n=1 Tax=Oedothorax gibbosus TaxID=931172 RepID=A0AAV6UWU1_9ARAC|nr:hypothetical protein JTE90_016622 [Oedothorax gibbosus]